MPRYRTALGIDISDGRIHLALLKKHDNSVKLLKTADGHVPDGAIRNGNIENPVFLAKAIRKLKTKNGIHVHPTAMSLVANPTLIQILDLPKDTSGNIRQVVHNEVKHYAMLPIKKAAVDFCGIKSSVKSGGRRALVVATDGQKITTASRIFNRQGLNIEVIEPAWMAYTRACYAKKIADKTDTNLLFATAFDGVLTLMVFKDNLLDFIRVKPLEPDPSQAEEEMNEVLKFYEFRTTGKFSQWQATLVTNIHEGPAEQKTKSLQGKYDKVELQIITSENAYLDTPVAEDINKSKPSAVAVGLAMGLLNTLYTSLDINLLPSEVTDAKSREKKILVMANIVAAVFVLMILGTAWINARMEKASEEIKRKKQVQVGENTQELLNEQALLRRQITEISARLEQINTAIDTDAILKWGPILNDIRDATPETVRIAKLDSNDNSKILLSGQAVTYEAVKLFIEALNTCKNIESASLVESQNENQSDSLVGYTISCLLTQ
jgi:Tfp pilus assembly protein PilN